MRNDVDQMRSVQREEILHDCAARSIDRMAAGAAARRGRGRAPPVHLNKRRAEASRGARPAVKLKAGATPMVSRVDRNQGYVPHRSIVLSSGYFAPCTSALTGTGGGGW